MSGPRLFDFLINDLPPAFVRVLIDGVRDLYPIAKDSVTRNPRIGEPEVPYLLGHTRRAYIEFMVREKAAANKLKFKVARADGVGGPEHTVVYAGRLRFTVSKESRHRDQYALIK